MFSLGSACTAEKAARNAAIKSAAAAAADGGEPRRDDFMVTNYIDGTIKKKGRTLRGGGGGESQRGLQHLFFCCRWPLAAAAIHAPPFNLRRHREETTLRTWLDPDGVIGVMSSLFFLGNPDWIIFVGNN